MTIPSTITSVRYELEMQSQDKFAQWYTVNHYPTEERARGALTAYTGDHTNNPNKREYRLIRRTTLTTYEVLQP